MFQECLDPLQTEYSLNSITQVMVQLPLLWEKRKQYIWMIGYCFQVRSHQNLYVLFPGDKFYIATTYVIDNACQMFKTWSILNLEVNLYSQLQMREWNHDGIIITNHFQLRPRTRTHPAAASASQRLCRYRTDLDACSPQNPRNVGHETVHLWSSCKPTSAVEMLNLLLRVKNKAVISHLLTHL